jgi:hypothetical protein
MLPQHCQPLVLCCQHRLHVVERSALRYPGVCSFQPTHLDAFLDCRIQRRWIRVVRLALSTALQSNVDLSEYINVRQPDQWLQLLERILWLGLQWFDKNCDYHVLFLRVSLGDCVSNVACFPALCNGSHVACENPLYYCIGGSRTSVPNGYYATGCASDNTRCTGEHN